MTSAGFNGLAPQFVNDRVSLESSAQRVLAETFPHNYATGPFLGITGTLYFQQIYLKAGDVVNTIHMQVGVAGAAETFARAGLYDTAGNLLASTPDQVAGWATVGLHSTNLSVPYTVTGSGIYYIAYLVLAGTMPSIVGNVAPAASRTGQTASIGGAPLYFGSQTGLADLPNPMTVAAGTAPGNWWFAVT